MSFRVKAQVCFILGVLTAVPSPLSGYQPVRLGLLAVWALGTVVWVCCELVRRYP